MSFKIFSLQLTGKIKPTATIEKQRAQLKADFDAFLKTESSEELKLFLELEAWANSEAYKNKKKEIEGLSYKGSKEEKEWKEFERLKKSGPIKKYFSVEGSSDLKRFEKERESDKLKNYYVLLDYMKEGQFEKDKKEISSQVFKGSVEEKHLLEYKKLAKSAGIKAYLELHGSEVLKRHEALANSEKFKKYNELKNASDRSKEDKAAFRKIMGDSEIKAYFKLEKSKKLKLYKEISSSHDLKRYLELKALVESKEFREKEAFLKDKQKFEKSEAYKKQAEFKRLAADDTVKFVLKYEKSSLYKNYLDVKDSFDLKRYHELDALLQSEEYRKQKAWLEDKKRWEKTPEYARYQQYLKDKQIPDFVNYFKYKDSKDFDLFRNLEVVFEDDFSGRKLDTEKWSTATPVADKLLGENYAMPGDLNIFTSGNNLKVEEKLVIQVKKEKAKGKVWQMPAGFVPTDFEYTSGLVSSAPRFMVEDGILEAKIKFDPVKQVVSSLYLTGEKATNRVNLLEMGARNHLGFTFLNGSGKVESQGIDISNLKKSTYIFSVEKAGSTFTWKINEVEILKQEKPEMNKQLFIEASSLVINPVSSAVNFEIEWVKCYRRK
ncbi:hypothetical protein INQ51_21455 [Maribellus sp. CM-23]|uniref:hypothetical protein n=1 Tax=Maribellus sp. CM-23 TaxID=2781026 RepID=UPI001F45C38B|nr:hypothetical protein [Maribellus sp. CM-23]MCE4566903.1 hypothetical protein [Maribellus sp. CM-23]